jgi:carbamoyl-phosphate synthase small subunit
MVGYPESLTDPSYYGQILVCTYPLIGNYGVGDPSTWESDKIQVEGLIVSTYNDTPSHYAMQRTLAQWLKDEGVPALEIKDTRFLAQKLRNEGNQLAKIIWNDEDVAWNDPNTRNVVAEVSPKDVTMQGSGDKTIVIIECGQKRRIHTNFLNRGVKIITVPWDFDVLTLQEKIDGVFISNGPGDPKMCDKTIENVRKVLEKQIPTLGICLGNQLLALAAGGDTYKLKFGHRSQNQPCILEGTQRAYLTTQNHGFAVGKIPQGFKPWFTNANDGTNEGIIHESLPFMSVQFHPESTPGPLDTEWIFDYFLEKIK